MPTDHSLYDLYPDKTPLIYTDGAFVYNELAKKFIRHKIGLFILAPSGSGKTHFIERQSEMHWLDGDHLWMSAKAMPTGSWWNESLETIFYIEKKCDVITTEAKKLGFWIIGASCNWLQPDAVVVPDWELHKAWIKKRETTEYDGGMTSDKLQQVINHRNWILTWQEKGVPKFDTVEEAAIYLAQQNSGQKS